MAKLLPIGRLTERNAQRPRFDYRFTISIKDAYFTIRRYDCVSAMKRRKLLVDRQENGGRPRSFTACFESSEPDCLLPRPRLNRLLSVNSQQMVHCGSRNLGRRTPPDGDCGALVGGASLPHSHCRSRLRPSSPSHEMKRSLSRLFCLLEFSVRD